MYWVTRFTFSGGPFSGRFPMGVANYQGWLLLPIIKGGSSSTCLWLSVLGSVPLLFLSRHSHMAAALLGGRVRFYLHTNWVWAVLGTGPVVLLLFFSALLGDPFLGRNPLLVLGSVPFIFAFFV